MSITHCAKLAPLASTLLRKRSVLIFQTVWYAIDEWWIDDLSIWNRLAHSLSLSLRRVLYYWGSWTLPRISVNSDVKCSVWPWCRVHCYLIRLKHRIPPARSLFSSTLPVITIFVQVATLPLGNVTEVLKKLREAFSLLSQLNMDALVLCAVYAIWSILPQHISDASVRCRSAVLIGLVELVLLAHHGLLKGSRKV